jgi:DNA polymerase IV (DinB-like DNA polymerase)
VQNRVVMLVDFDYFFAQVEELRNPSIRDKPVVVCVYSGRSEDSGAVSTANYVARNLGVKSGMPIVLAKKRLQGVESVFLPVDYAFYEAVSAKIMSLLRAYADRFEQVGVDEAYLDVSQRTKGIFEDAKLLAEGIKKEVVAQHGLTCSIGVGPNRLVAKMAADSSKPNGLTIVGPNEVVGFLAPLPVDRLIGVGPKTRERMHRLGITTIGDLAKCNVQRLLDVFGKKLGSYFHNASAGIDDEPVHERGEAESISRISTLKEDTCDLSSILERSDRECEEIHEDLSRGDFGFRTITVMAVLKDMSVRSRSRTLDDYSDRLDVLKETVRELFGNFLAESDLEFRRVGVKVSGLTRRVGDQRRLTSFMEQRSDGTGD